MPIGIQNEHTKDPFDDFLDTLKEPREIIQETPIIDDEPAISTEPAPESSGTPSFIEKEEPDPVLERKKQELAMLPAETIVDVIDTTSISLNTYIAQEPVDGATPAEKQSLQKAIANYLRETDIDISPGKMCVLLILMIYGPKTVQAFQLRKANQENERLKAQVSKLENQLRQRKETTDEISDM